MALADERNTLLSASLVRALSWSALGLIALGAIWVAARGLWAGMLLLAASLAAGIGCLRLGNRIPDAFGLLFTLALVLNTAGFVGELYERVWWYDEFMHLYGGFVIVLVLGPLAWPHLPDRTRSDLRRLILVLTGLGVGVGLLWEAAEGVGDLVLPGSDLLNGLWDTGSDLLLDVVGAFLGAKALAGGLKDFERKP